LPFRDAGAFVEENSSDAASDLRSDSRAAARCHVPAGIQKSVAAAGAGGLVHGSDFNEWLLVPKGIHPAGDAREDHQTAEEDCKAFAKLATFALPFVYAQRAEIVLCRTEWRGH